MHIVPLEEVDSEAVEALLDRAFGSERHARTAYRVRAGATILTELCFAALDGADLVGSIQCWPVALHSDDDGIHPLVMVGPVAVEPVRQRLGIGHLLMDAALAAWAARATPEPLMLIGDPDYYGRLFGFSAQQTGWWRLPGPFEPHRLLARGAGIPDQAGMIGARQPAPV